MIETAKKIIIHQRKTLDKTLEFIDKFSKKYSDKLLIIRPHPSENHKMWFDLEKKYKNIICIYDDMNTCSWILASKFSISSNCTTALESMIMGKKNYNFRPYLDQDVEFVLPQISGVNVHSVDEMLEVIKSEDDLTNEYYDENKKKLISKFIHNYQNNNCSVENILNILDNEKFDKNTKKKNLDLKFYLKKFYIIFYKYYFKLRYKLNLFLSFEERLAYQKFPGLNKKELEQKIFEIQKTLDINFKFAIEEELDGVFKIYKIN